MKQHLEKLITRLKMRAEKSASKGMVTQGDYECVLDEAANLRIYKVLQYGEERYEEKDEEIQLWMLYCDIWRKFSRLRMLIKNILHNKDDESLEKLRSDCLDMLNYGAMGVQIIDQIKANRKVSQIDEGAEDVKKLQ